MARLFFDSDRRKLRFFDWTSFVILLILSCTSLFFVFSATQISIASISCSSFFIKQLFGVISGFGIFFLAFFFDYRTLQKWGTVGYYVTIILLIFTLVKGSVGMGAQRWVNLGFIKFQPSELAKLFFPAFFATSVASDETGELKHRSFIPVFFVLGLSVVLILKQPDLGTALLVLFSGILLLWLANIGRPFFIALFIVSAISAPIAWHNLKPYQKNRIIVFLGGGTSRKERYQIEQSQIAIGSGGFWGKGFLQGTQTRLNFLPESRTDFIFSVICEELGFVGAALVIFLFGLLFLRLVIQIAFINNISAQLLAIGLLTPLIFSTVINICMVLGLLPTVGIPLPFISYGITHLWIGFASLGWCINIIARASIIP
ncbi:MAG: rod shape-determining protein RodA [Candidatus Babeliaceae bacterium]|nr:rod shape-determining protein RodA [Candidatus Babeliaceae bacterium]